MTDLEMNRLAAEAMGYAVDETWPDSTRVFATIADKWTHYDPLHDDAQAMALLKRWPHLCIPAMTYALFESCNDIGPSAKPVPLNRAIVEAVAKMQSAKVHLAHSTV